MRSERWYQIRLAKYFDEHYTQYDETAEFYPDPSINQWSFDLPDVGAYIKLMCDDNGKITEVRYRYREGREKL